MNLRIKISILFAISLLVVGQSCKSNKNKFVVSGIIKNADGQALYLEELGTGNVLSIDSVVLSKDGDYKFAYETTEYPMFYRLRIKSNYIPFVAYGESKIKINSDNNNLFKNYIVLESDIKDNKLIKEISYNKYKTDSKIDSVLFLYTNNFINVDVARSSVDSISKDFKEYLLNHFIYANPKSASAYYALFLQKDGAAYFSADDPNDEKAFAAIATAYDTYYKDAPYTPFLKDMALKAIAQSRIRNEINKNTVNVDFIDFPSIEGSDQRGNKICIDSISKTNEILLCFTQYASDYSTRLVSVLKQINEKNKAIKIIDISLDRDYYFWKNASVGLPWSSINDIDGTISKKYNIHELPTVFLIKDGKVTRLNSIEEFPR